MSALNIHVHDVDVGKQFRYTEAALNIHVHDVDVGKQFRYTEGTSLVHLSELSNSSTEFKGVDDRVFWWQLQVLFVVFIYCIFSIML